MYHVQGILTGQSPILFNSPGPVLSNPVKGKAPGKMTDDELRVRALEKLHTGEQGIYLPDSAFTAALFAGANFAGLKDGKRSLSTLLKAIVFIEGPLLFGKTEPDFIHAEWGRIPPRTGAMIVLRRPALDTGWRLPFRLLIADDRIQDDDLKTALDTAGVLVGLGAWRPRLGRFIVTEWGKAP